MFKANNGIQRVTLGFASTLLALSSCLASDAQSSDPAAMAKRHYQNAVAAIGKDDWPAAERELLQAEKLAPQNALVRYDLALAYSHTGKDKFAQAELHRALQLGLPAEQKQAAEELQHQLQTASMKPPVQAAPPLPDGVSLDKKAAIPSVEKPNGGVAANGISQTAEGPPPDLQETVLWIANHSDWGVNDTHPANQQGWSVSEFSSGKVSMGTNNDLCTLLVDKVELIHATSSQSDKGIHTRTSSKEWISLGKLDPNLLTFLQHPQATPVTFFLQMNSMDNLADIPETSILRDLNYRDDDGFESHTNLRTVDVPVQNSDIGARLLKAWKTAILLCGGKPSRTEPF